MAAVWRYFCWKARRSSLAGGVLGDEDCWAWRLAVPLAEPSSRLVVVVAVSMALTSAIQTGDIERVGVVRLSLASGKSALSKWTGEGAKFESDPHAR